MITCVLCHGKISPRKITTILGITGWIMDCKSCDYQSDLYRKKNGISTDEPIGSKEEAMENYRVYNDFFNKHRR